MPYQGNEPRRHQIPKTRYQVSNGREYDQALQSAAAASKKETGGAQGVPITVPSLSAFQQGIGLTRKRGTCVLVGLPPGEFPVPLFGVVANCITVMARGPRLRCRSEATNEHSHRDPRRSRTGKGQLT
jgi:threonine dehydrogenase-like Zn-dependent dehydrogenase